jgi:hypothetical protein
MSGIHPIGQVLNHDNRAEFQTTTGVEHIHAIIHIKDAPKIDYNNQAAMQKVVDFIDNTITTEIPDPVKYPELNNLVTTVQHHHHTKTCKKKKGKICRFDAPWPITDKTVITPANTDKESYKKAKEVIKKVETYLKAKDPSDLNNLTLEDVLLEVKVSFKDYEEALQLYCLKDKVTYKRKPNAIYISPYNTVILATLRSNMNIQFVTGVYAVLAYLTSYLCKPEHAMSELMKKTIKEAENLPPSDRLRLGGKTFVDKKEESCHQALKYLLGSPMGRSNIDVVFIQTGHDSTQTRVLKSAIELSRLSDEDQDVFKTSLLDKYKARPLSLESKCLMYFATNYVHAKSTDASVEEETTIDGFLKPVAEESTGNIYTLEWHENASTLP